MFKNLFGKQRKDSEDIIVSPVAGMTKDLSECSDPVFAQGMMGPGIVIMPSGGKLYSPVDGTVEVLFETLHAIGFKTDAGNDVMLHVGIDTVELAGAPFQAHVSQGEHVNKGDLLLDVDLDAIRAAGKSEETVIALSNSEGHQVTCEKPGAVNVGDPILSVR